MKHTMTLALAASMFLFAAAISPRHAHAAVNAYLYINPPHPETAPASSSLLSAILLVFGL